MHRLEHTLQGNSITDHDISQGPVEKECDCCFEVMGAAKNFTSWTCHFCGYDACQDCTSVMFFQLLNKVNFH